MRRWLAILTLLCASATYATDSWIPVNSPVSGEPCTVTVQNSGSHSWQIHVSVSGLSVQPVLLGAQSLSRISLPAETFAAIPNIAELPAISRFVGLRSSGDPTLEIVSEEWTDIEGQFNLAPPEESNAGSSVPTDAFLPESAALVTPRMIMGGVPLCDVQITAVMYNPVQHKIRALRDMTILVHESGAAVSYPRGITETIAQVLRPTMSNWNDLALDELVVRGTYLFVLADSAVSRQQIAQLVTWRKRKGYRVEVAGPSQIGTPLTTTNVKSYIQSRYNGANPPLEFVCMVGDGNGSYIVPSYTYHAPDEFGVYGVGDFGYTQLDGTDLLPDISIGRFWFTSSPELLTQINKTLRYEQTPAARSTGTHPSWYQAAGVVGDYDNQALSVSHIQTMRWVRERMLDAGYPNSSVDTLYWSDYGNGPINPSVIIASLNSGASLWCYRGWNRMNQFSISNIAGLNNVGDWPFMLNMTCNTNDYNQADAPCLGEAFMVPNATPSNPAGAIGFVGMSSGGTHSRFNNIQMGGAVQGLLREGIHTTGGSLIRAKLEMIHNFPMSDESPEVEFFEGITTLLGDPAVDVYTDTPDTLSVNNPATVPVGTNGMTLTVTLQGGVPADSAYVNLVKGTEVFVGGYTNSSGQIVLNFLTTTADTMFVTASRHNGKAAIGYTLVTTSAGNVSPVTSTFTLDDDNNGASHGNGDGHANPGEGIELAIPLRNWGTATVTNISATLSTNDSYITGISPATESYGTIPPNSNSTSGSFVFTVANYVPDGHVVQFTLTSRDGGSNTWPSLIPIPLSNAKVSYVSTTLSGVGDGVLDPGESGQMYLTLLNGGTRALSAGRVGYLRSSDPSVRVTDSVGTFAALAVGGQGNNQSDPFGVSATTSAIPGQRVPMTCIFPLSDGFADTVHFSLTVGTVASNTPTPPDVYGYWAFDNTDTAYAKHPTYNWVEIDPDSGGGGTHLDLTDNADGADASTVVNLPFTFQYYGQSYNQITVCTNGWMAMGGDQVAHTDFRNYDIPSAIGASRLIAPFWDDLRTSQPLTDMARSRGRNQDHPLDDGGENCSSAAVISSLPYTDTGNTCQHSNSQCMGGNQSQDVFYRYSVPAGGQTLEISLCGSGYSTRLLVWSACCISGDLLAADSTSCPDGHARIRRDFSQGDIWIMIEGWGWGHNTCGDYSLSVSQYVELPPGHICTRYDAVNHRFIVEWNGLFKYNAMDNPREIFECILRQPGYPATPTGDGEILFQYANITNAVDVAASNDYCTAGIENLDQTDGVLYSYMNQISPDIPGAASLESGRAVLFTTARLTSGIPAAPTGLTVYPSGSSVVLRWRPVTTDVIGNPLTNVQYYIYRGTQFGFVPDGNTFLTNVTTTSYADPIDASTAYFYVVQAVVGGAALEIAPTQNTGFTPK